MLEMARTAAAGFWSQVRACTRSVRRCLGRHASLLAGLILLAIALPATGHSRDPVKGEATFSAANGHARLVLKLAEDVNSQVTTAGSIVVIRFDHPVDIDVDAIGDAVPDYVSAARRDPDGTAIRLSLARKVTLNTMTAGERVFVDFLPDTWAGPPPSLPLDVVRELAERARLAEKALRQQHAEAMAKKRPPIRVRALVQPTFVRFVFEMPDGVGASSVLNDQKLTLFFTSLLNFDLADAKVGAPPNVASINQKVENDTTQVEITLIGDVDVHSFREDKNYIIDVAFQQPDKSKAQSQLSPSDLRTPPELQAPAAKSEAKTEAALPKPEAARAPVAATMDAKSEGKTSDGKTSEGKISDGKTELKSEPAAKPQAVADKPQALAEAMKQAPPAEAAKAPTPAPSPAPPVAVAQKPTGPAPAKEGPPAGTEAAKTAPVVAKNAPEPSTMPAPQPAAVAKKPADASAQDNGDNGPPAKLEAVRDSEGLRITFTFAKLTPAASFRRGDTVWLVFDSRQPIDLEPIRAKGGAIVGEVSRMLTDKGQAIRIRVNRPQLHTLTSDEFAAGSRWTLTFADKTLATAQPLMVVRNITDPAHANIAVSFAGGGELHHVTDPDAGDTLLVVTGLVPIRGLIKRQDFVDFTLLDTAQGVVVRPNSDSVAVEVGPDKVIVGKPGGLTISSVDASAERAPTAVRPVFDIDDWHKNQAGDFIERRDALIIDAGAADPDNRGQARLELARFYMARGLYPEAAGEAAYALA